MDQYHKGKAQLALSLVSQERESGDQSDCDQALINFKNFFDQLQGAGFDIQMAEVSADALLQQNPILNPNVRHFHIVYRLDREITLAEIYTVPEAGVLKFYKNPDGPLSVKSVFGREHEIFQLVLEEIRDCSVAWETKHLPRLQQLLGGGKPDLRP